MIGQFVNKINELYDKRLDRIRSISDMKYDLNLISPYLDKSKPLTGEQKHEIKNRWGCIIPYLSRGYKFYQALTVLDQFSVDYLPASYYSPIIENTLNPVKYKTGLSHKGMSQLIYKGIVKFPHTVLRLYNGLLFDQEYNPVSLSKAVEILKSEDSPLIYKPALLTAQGMGISIINTIEKTQICAQLSSMDKSPLSDFVIQRIVEQSPETKILNPSSLNCMRITTLNLNNKISVCTRAIKCGPANSIVDNIGTGKRGVAVGINEDGSLHPNGFYGNGEMTSFHNGIEFSGIKIPRFEEILNSAIELHRVNPICKLIGWDLALDKYNNVILIEGNTVCPSISFEQMATGPVFGTRTEEVIDYIITHKCK